MGRTWSEADLGEANLDGADLIMANLSWGKPEGGERGYARTDRIGDHR